MGHGERSQQSRESLQLPGQPASFALQLWDTLLVHYYVLHQVDLRYRPSPHWIIRYFSVHNASAG